MSRLSRLCGAALGALALTVGPAVAAEPVREVLIRVDPHGAATARAGAEVGATLEVVTTLGQAVERAARRRTGEPRAAIVIEIAPGTHRLDRPVRLGPEHGGTPEAPLVIRGARDGSSRIVGSVALRPDPEPLDGATLARVPAPARGEVRAYRLPPAALASRRIRPPQRLRSPAAPLGLEVYDRSGAMMPARWPNDGWAQVKAPAGTGAFTLSGHDVARWRGEPDLWAEGYWRWGWLFEAIPIAAIDAPASRIRLEAPSYEGILAGARVRVSHALSELDEPGEWWRDLARGRLIAWPRPGADELEVAVTNSLFRIEGASHVRLERLRLEQARGDLITVRGGEDVIVTESALAWSGGRGVAFEDARLSGILRCDISDTGREAVRLSGGDRATLTSGGLFVRDSRFTRYARLSRTQSPALDVDGVGATVSGNYIHDTNEYAVHLHGNDHVVEWNEISHLLGDATDSGAVYSGRDWTARGSVIQHNFLHDIRAREGAEIKGVYLDDMASGFTVRENLFLRVDQPVFIGGGRDNVVERNLFAASSPAIHIDSRGEALARDAITDPESELRAALAAMPVGSAIWRARYPGLAGILADEPGVAKGNRILGNLFLASEPFRFDQAGAASRQTIAGNTAAAGIDPAVLAQSGRPADFSRLLGDKGQPAPGLDLSRARRSMVLGDPFAP